MKKYALTLTLWSLSLLIFAQHKQAYQIFDANGKKSSYKKMIKSIQDQDVLMFGELHNNAIAHWLQLEVTNDLNQNRSLILGAEMIEADNQDELNQYLDGTVNQKGLDTLARLWPNYDTDYAPLVNFAKKNQLKFIGTNIPRRYANMVYKNGFESLDSLTAQEKSWIAPLPIAFDPELPTYQNILKMMGDHGSPKLVMAQAMKDATMSHFIMANYASGNLFVHYNGAYHSDFFEGIVWYLKKSNPQLKIKTISTVSQESLKSLEEEHLDKADYIICVDSDMTNTY